MSRFVFFENGVRIGPVLSWTYIDRSKNDQLDQCQFELKKLPRFNSLNTIVFDNSTEFVLDIEAINGNFVLANIVAKNDISAKVNRFST
jgi:hypothetical protein